MAAGLIVDEAGRLQGFATSLRSGLGGVIRFVWVFVYWQVLMVRGGRIRNLRPRCRIVLMCGEIERCAKGLLCGD